MASKGPQLNTTEKVKGQGPLKDTLNRQMEWEMSKTKSPDGREAGGKSLKDKDRK